MFGWLLGWFVCPLVACWDGLIVWLVGYLGGYLGGYLVGLLAIWLVIWLVHWLIVGVGYLAWRNCVYLHLKQQYIILEKLIKLSNQHGDP
jgi:hypothetical protein